MRTCDRYVERNFSKKDIRHSRRIRFFPAVLLVFTALFLLIPARSVRAFDPLPVSESVLLAQQLIPAPKSLQLGSGSVSINENLTVTVTLGRAGLSNTESKKLAGLFQNWFGRTPKIQIQKKNGLFTNKADGAYSLTAEDHDMKISAASFEGVFNAMKTLRQLAEPIPGTKTITGWTVVPVKIEDEPSMAFRGLHLCWFPETRAERIEQAIRMAAFYKFNYVVLEFWGVYPFKALPEFCWAEHATNEKEIRRLVRLAGDLGVVMIPQFNMFGHASAARGSAAKHCLLDFHPEYAPLFEPSGWCWCLSNTETRKVLTGMIEELLDLFDNPPYIHLGCDEADTASTCPLCRKADYKKLLIDHFRYFGELAQKHNARPMIWHDMLIRHSDPRWRGYVVNGPDWADDVLKNLSKKYILCDWQYSAPKPEEKWPTIRYFMDQKFDVVACPWENARGINSLGAFVKKEKSFGLLCTTWHHFSGSKMRLILINGADSCWGGSRTYGQEGDVFARHLRLINQEAGFKKYIDFGITDLQLDDETKP